MATEYAYESEGEFSPLHYAEEEADPFFGLRRIGSFARRLARSPVGGILKKLAPHAARLIVGAIPGVGAVAGPLAGKLVSALTREQQEQLEAALQEISGESSLSPEMLGGAMGESLDGEVQPEGLPETRDGFGEVYEDGGSSEWQEEAGETESLGGGEGLGEGYENQPEAPYGAGNSEGNQETALMEQIAQEAAMTHNQPAAEALVGSLVPLAMRAARVPRAGLRAAPALTVATSRLTRALRSSPATRSLIRVVPPILARTGRILARSAAQGRPVAPQRAVRVMAQQTYRVFNTPELAIHILIRSGRRRRLYRRAI